MFGEELAENGDLVGDEARGLGISVTHGFLFGPESYDDGIFCGGECASSTRFRTLCSICYIVMSYKHVFFVPDSDPSCPTRPPITLPRLTTDINFIHLHSLILRFSH